MLGQNVIIEEIYGLVSSFSLWNNLILGLELGFILWIYFWVWSGPIAYYYSNGSVKIDFWV